MKSTVLITGAAKGIGHACARVFYRSGWRVIGLDITPATDSQPFESFLSVDLGNPEALSTAAQQVRARTDELNALINNAAVQVIRPLLDTSEKDFEKVMCVNLKAPFALTKALFPVLKKNRGAVINVSSVHAQATSADIGVYAASKAALASLTRTMAIEFGPYGVRVNALLPGAIDTDMLRSGLTRNQFAAVDEIDKKIERIARRHPLGRVGRPEDVAAAALFLADPEQSSFITGHCLSIDGGCLARLSTE